MTDAPSKLSSFERAPHRTLIGLSVPVLISLVAEPVTGLVDTAFVAQLGADSLAGLGVGAIALSAVFWIFNFLGIGTQTQVAQAWGRQDRTEAMRDLVGLAVRLAVALGVGAIILGLVLTRPIAEVLGASGSVLQAAHSYMLIRWLGAPAMLVMLASFGALRGRQDMRTPLWIAVGMNGLNVILDAVLVQGAGPIPALGIAGVAWASTVSQWVGAWAALSATRSRVGISLRGGLRGASSLIRIGGDLFVRTGMLTLFLLLATRSATRLGPEAGAAHQAIRQVWIFTALFLDAWAVAAQSLIGFQVGAHRLPVARKVAVYACGWSLATSFVLALALWAATPLVELAVVPVNASGVFAVPWLITLLFLPVSGLTFATDGIHWGTGDFGYLRTATVSATLFSGAILIAFESTSGISLAGIWWLTGVWSVIRAGFGLVRIWPGVGNAPLRIRERQSVDNLEGPAA